MSSSQPMPMGFVDANILADAILAQNAIDEIFVEGMLERKPILETSKEVDEVFASYEPARLAHTFFLMLRAQKTPMYFVLTSNLALLEAKSVIADEYVQRRLLSRKIMRHSENAKAKVRLSNHDVTQIFAGIHIFRTRVGQALIVQDEYETAIADQLVAQFMCSARDAILVATALKNGCPRFITRDDRLKRKLMRFKQVRLTSIQTLIDELRPKITIPHAKS